MNDNSIAIASPINLGLPKGIAITPNTEIKMRNFRKRFGLLLKLLISIIPGVVLIAIALASLISVSQTLKGSISRLATIRIPKIFMPQVVTE